MRKAPRGGRLREVAPVGGVDVIETQALPHARQRLLRRSPQDAEASKFPGESTPDRSKLFGSHGQRPWFQQVMKRSNGPCINQILLPRIRFAVML